MVRDNLTISFIYWNISFVCACVCVIIILTLFLYENKCIKSLTNECNVPITEVTKNWLWISFKVFNGLFSWCILLWNFEDFLLDKVFIFSSTWSRTFLFHSMSTNLLMTCLLHHVSIESLSLSVIVDLAFSY